MNNGHGFECGTGTVVVDVGVNVMDSGQGRKRRLTGDVSFAEVKPKTSAITPVPGGVGPLTVAMLFANTIRAAKCRALHNLPLRKSNL